MRRIILTVFLSLFFVISISAQHNISYGIWIPTDCAGESPTILVASGHGLEGEEFIIPKYTIPDKYLQLGDYFKYLQFIANAFAGAKIGLPEGTLNEDVALEIDLTSAKCGTPFDNLEEALSFTVKVVGGTEPNTTSYDPFSYYYFNEGKKAYIVFKVENLLPLLDELNMNIDEIFGWFSKEGYPSPDRTGISLVAGDTEFTLYLSHFSKIALGAYVNPTDVKTIEEIPGEYNLAQNYPNPFNPTTNITFSLPKSGFTKLTVYNSIGIEIKTLVSEVKAAGTYKLVFDASELTSGIYFYDLASNNFRSTKKMILIK